MPRQQRPSRRRNWCFTINNPNQLEENQLGQIIADIQSGQGFGETVRYLVYQLETAPSSTQHYQGYIQFLRPLTMRQVKGIISQRCHLEPARGSPEANKRYCTKDQGRLAGPWEAGTPMSQGRRTDIQAVCEEIMEGKTPLAIWGGENQKEYFKY